MITLQAGNKYLIIKQVARSKLMAPKLLSVPQGGLSGLATGGYTGTAQDLQTEILAMGDPDFDFEQQVDTLLTF